MRKSKIRLKIGQSKITHRKLDGKRRKVIVRKVGRNKEKVRIIGKRKKR